MMKIIADIGSNHQGDLDKAMSLIHAAVQAGADVAKFQFFRGKGSWRDPRFEKVWSQNELPAEWIGDLAHSCEKVGVEFLCSVFDPRHIPLLNPYVKAWKLASIAAADSLLLQALARTGKPLILSTGFMSRAGLLRSINLVRSLGVKAVWMYCQSVYPCPVGALNLERMRSLMNWVLAAAGEGETRLGRERIVVGLSDHSVSLLSGAVAAGMGATVLEKHIKLPAQESTPDAGHSLDPDQFKIYAATARQAESMLGSGHWPMALELNLARIKDCYVSSLDRFLPEGGER